MYPKKHVHFKSLGCLVLFFQQSVSLVSFSGDYKLFKSSLNVRNGRRPIKIQWLQKGTTNFALNSLPLVRGTHCFSRSWCHWSRWITEEWYTSLFDPYKEEQKVEWRFDKSPILAQNRRKMCHAKTSLECSDCNKFGTDSKSVCICHSRTDQDRFVKHKAEQHSH
jgi:hypothetical protein